MTTAAMLLKELRPPLRNGRTLVLAMGALLVLGVTVANGISTLAESGSFAQRSFFGRNLFFDLMGTQAVFGSLLGVVLGAGALTREREQHTLDLLRCASPGHWPIVRGKWVSILALLLLVLVISLPLSSVSFSLGGVGLAEALALALSLAVLFASWTMIGLAISAWARRSLPAMVLGLLLLVMIELILAHTIRGGPAAWFVSLGEAIRIWGDPGATPVRQWATFGRFAGVRLVCLAMAAALACRGLTRSGRAWRLGRLTRRRASLLRRQRPVRDGSNPVFVKETRGWLGVAHRAAMVAGVALAIMALFQSFFGGEPLTGWLAIPGLLLLTIPLFGAPIVSREREEGTWALLLASPLTNHQIIWGKFHAVFMPWLWLLGPSMLVHVVVYMLRSTESSASYWILPAGIMGAMLALAGYLTTISIYCSLKYRTSAAALVATYCHAFVALVFFVPLILFLAPLIAWFMYFGSVFDRIARDRIECSWEVPSAAQASSTGYEGPHA